MPGALEKAGFDPATALAGSTLGEHLSASGVKTYAFQPFHISNSGLSRMFLRGAQVKSYSNAVDLAINLRELVESEKAERQFIGLYWGQVDHLSHVYGPDDERPAADFAHFSSAFERFFLDELSPEARRDTLLIMVADHGQVTTTKDPFYDLKSHPSLLRRLTIYPTGENRLIYFHIKPGQTEAVREYLSKTFLNQFVQLDPGYALENGLFGPGPINPKLRDRLGDLMAVAKGNAFLWWGDSPNPIFGRHGGLSPEEMLVPLVAAHL